MHVFRRVAAAILAAIGLSVMLVGCGNEDTSALGQIRPGQTACADLWDEGNDEGDQALAEQKPSGLWVIDTSVKFRTECRDNFDVKVTLDKKDGFVVLDMGGTRVGKDHDDCLSVSDGDHEHYAQMSDNTVQFEKEDDSGKNNDDCVVAPEDAA